MARSALVGIVLSAFATLTAVAAAALRFWSSTVTKQDQANVQAWCAAKWAILAKSPWFRIPNKLVLSLLDARSRFAQRAIKFIREAESGTKSIAFYWTMAGSGIAALAFFKVMFYDSLYLKHFDASTPVFVGFGFMIAFGLINAAFNRRYNFVFISLAAASILLPLAQIVLSTVLILPLWLSVVVMIILGPWIAGLIAMPLSGGDNVLLTDNAIIFGASGSASFAVTTLALLVGKIFEPTAFVPTTVQMLLTNVAFDAVTVVVTITVLSLTIGDRRCISIPFAVVVDLSLAALFAFSSLWCGVAFTPHALNFHQIANVLIARTPAGDHWATGPYFFAMHTTFLPTFFYLAFVVLCWLAKMFLSVVLWFFGKGRHPDINPIGLASGFIGLLAALFGAAASAVAILRQVLRSW
jgi:hypothetical protein